MPDGMFEVAVAPWCCRRPRAFSAAARTCRCLIHGWTRAGRVGEGPTAPAFPLGAVGGQTSPVS